MSTIVRGRPSSAYVLNCACLIFAAILPVSCVSSPGQPPHSSSLSGISPYCDLLHVAPSAAPARPPKSYLGIYMAPREALSSEPSCSGKAFVQAAGIIDGSPAAKAGLALNDIVLSLNDTFICGDTGTVVQQFRKAVEQQKPGAPVLVSVLRSEKKLSLPAVLETRPAHDQPEASHPGSGSCTAGASALERSLRDQNALSSYYETVTDLAERSNIVHNPGSEREKRLHPLQSDEVTYLLRRPLSAGTVAAELSERLTGPLAAGNRDLGATLSRGMSLLNFLPAPTSTPAEISFPALLKSMHAAKKLLDEAYAGLTPEERTLLTEKAFDPGDDAQWNKVLEISLKMDRERVVGAAFLLLPFLTKDNLAILKQDLIARFGSENKPILHESMEQFGKVIVGGTGGNVYETDAALILDIGGGDLYLNNAGGTRKDMPLALVIDWGGNDRYAGREPFSQGAGLLGAGFLIDLGGDDTFVALDGSQGAGFWGLGLLFHGEGNALFRTRKFSQGAGQMGLGVLITEGGNDHYTCSYAGQGLGLFGGAGALIDQAGNDAYELGGLEPDERDPARATESMGQGFGLGMRPDKNKNGVPGGIGMLIDISGNDRYLADHFAQGASYYFGLGILDDRAGDDNYIAARYAQGSGVHSAIGVLLDRQGNDLYYASFGVSQGMGHDSSVGVLEDGYGNDRYQGGVLLQGAATNSSIGMLIDRSGSDVFSCKESCGGFAAEGNGMGIMIGREPRAGGATITIGRKKE